jgi:fructose-specific phosphotransferase system IIC component
MDNDAKKTKCFWRIYHAVLLGISKVIPVIVTGGLLIAFSNLIGVQLLHFDFSGNTVSSSPLWMLLYLFVSTGKLLLTLILPLLAAFTAVNISNNNDSFVPGLIGGLLARGGELGVLTQTGSGYIGALLAGICSGYLILFFEKYIHPGKVFHAFDNVFVIPLIVSIIISSAMYYIVGPAVGGLNQWFLDSLVWMQANNLSILAGAITGAFANFDFGGPINKIAYMFSTSLWSSGVTVFYSAFTAAKIIPSFSIAISSVLVPSLYSSSEKKQVLPALLMSVFGGIGEGVLPFALKNPISVIPSMMVSGAVSAIIVLYENIGISIGAGGSLMTVGLTSDPLKWMGAFILGIVISTALLIVIRIKAVKK